jgi:hypothetical protein
MGLAVLVLSITLILRFGYDLFWTWGIALATILAIVSLFTGKSK